MVISYQLARYICLIISVLFFLIAQMVNNGEASWSGVDASLRPPEVIIETSFDTKVDVWMIGCAVRFVHLHPFYSS